MYHAHPTRHSTPFQRTVVVDVALVNEVASVDEFDEDTIGSEVLESDEMKRLASPSLSIISGRRLTIYHTQSVCHNKILLKFIFTGSVLQILHEGVQNLLVEPITIELSPILRIWASRLACVKSRQKYECNTMGIWE